MPNPGQVVPLHDIETGTALTSDPANNRKYSISRGTHPEDVHASAGVSLSAAAEHPPLPTLGTLPFLDELRDTTSMRAAPLAKLSSGTVRLSKVDKMLYSTCTQEAPMIINTLLTMDGLVPIDQLKSFLTELAFKHPRLRMRVVDKGGHPTWTPTDLNLDSVVHYHRVPPNTTFVEYIDKKKLLEGQIDTTSHLWEWHGILDNDGNHVFLVRLHHVLGDGLSLVKLVMSMFDSDEVSEYLKSEANKSKATRTLWALVLLSRRPDTPA